MVKAKDPKGPWTEPVLVKPDKGLIDTCPFWDEDGKVYECTVKPSRTSDRSLLQMLLAE